MRVLITSPGQDNGGIGIAIKRAFAKHAPDITVHSVTRETNYIGWEPDVIWPWGKSEEQVVDLIKKADVIHVMDRFDGYEGLPGFSGKPKVMHHHGVDFKANPDRLMAKCRAEGIPQFVATHDLLSYGEDLTWLPNPVDIDVMQQTRSEGDYDRSLQPERNHLLVMQTPSGRDKNGTSLFLRGMLEVVGALPSIVEGKRWVECMRLKAQADAVFDSFGVGYGITTLEAWGMGLPVIHGSDDKTEQAVIDTIGYTPYHHVAPENFTERMQEFVDDPELRSDVWSRGWTCVNEVHSEERVVENLKSIYESAL